MEPLKDRLMGAARCNLLTGDEMTELLFEAVCRIDELEDTVAYLTEQPYLGD